MTVSFVETVLVVTPLLNIESLRTETVMSRVGRFLLDDGKFWESEQLSVQAAERNPWQRSQVHADRHEQSCIDLLESRKVGRRELLYRNVLSKA